MKFNLKRVKGIFRLLTKHTLEIYPGMKRLTRYVFCTGHSRTNKIVAQLAGAVFLHNNKCPEYDTKQSESEAPDLELFLGT